MKNVFLKMVSVLVCLPLSSLASQQAGPTCPDASVLQGTAVSFSASGKYNEPVTVVTSVNKYGTAHYWSMEFLVSSGTLQGAIDKAKNSLDSLNFEYGPHYYQGKWVCSYHVDEPGVLKVSAVTSFN
jgi:hypothetical protein